MPDKFGCVVNCIDGRVQLPVAEWIKFHAAVQYVDVITEPGADGVIASGQTEGVKSIYSRLSTAIRAHNPGIVAVTGHFDCIANPTSPAEHVEHIKRSTEVISSWVTGVRITGLYVNEYGTIDVVYDSNTQYREIRSYL